MLKIHKQGMKNCTCQFPRAALTTKSHPLHYDWRLSAVQMPVSDWGQHTLPRKIYVDSQAMTKWTKWACNHSLLGENFEYHCEKYKYVYHISRTRTLKLKTRIGWVSHVSTDHNPSSTLWGLHVVVTTCMGSTNICPWAKRWMKCHDLDTYWWVSATKNVTPLLTHWSYIFIALTHWYVIGLVLAY